MLSRVGRAAQNLLRLPLFPLWLLGRLLLRPRTGWVLVRVRPRLTELSHPRSFLLRFVPSLARALPTPLDLLRRLARHAVDDDRVQGVVFVIPPLLAGWATCAALRDVMARLRNARKPVVAYLPRGGGNKELFVAAGADRIYLGPQASLLPLGLSVEAKYMKPLLDKLGIAVEAFARGEYKTAAEPALRDSMSDAQREQIGALLSTMDQALVDALLSRPGMDAERVRAALDLGVAHGQDAVDAGLADGVCYEDELGRVIADGGEPVRLLRAPRYLSGREARFFLRVLPRPYVAVIEVHGTIAEHTTHRGVSSGELGRVVSAVRAVRRDRFAVGLLLHVSSPGGSAVASDLIYRELLRLRERKPVVACFGDVAASGGYYIAAAADSIVAQPVTVTGSIGVVSVKMMMGGLFETLGIRTETIRTHAHADMFSTARPLDQAERAILEHQMDAFYEAFVGIVARGRSRPVDEIEPLARGRVWSGQDALERGLVDHLGGFDTALDELRSRTRVPPSMRRRLEPRLVTAPRGEIPPPEPPEPSSPNAAHFAAALLPELADLLHLATTRERVLYYAPLLPDVE